ncbi:MAG: hypothetical protein ACJ746_31815 [Bryobacteraceae bacterium]
MTDPLPASYSFCGGLLWSFRELAKIQGLLRWNVTGEGKPDRVKPKDGAIKFELQASLFKTLVWRKGPVLELCG